MQFGVKVSVRDRTTEGTITLIIGDRLCDMRDQKKLSQDDSEKRTGLPRCYTSRVENGHTVQAIETLEKLARALEVLLYQLFYEGEEPPKLPNLPKRKSSDDIDWGSSGIALVVYVQQVWSSPVPASSLPVKLYVVFAPLVSLLLVGIIWRHNHSTYQHKPAQWYKSFICKRCGRVSQQSLG